MWLVTTRTGQQIQVSASSRCAALRCIAHSVGAAPIFSRPEVY